MQGLFTNLTYLFAILIRADKWINLHRSVDKKETAAIPYSVYFATVSLSFFAVPVSI